MSVLEEIIVCSLFSLGAFVIVICCIFFYGGDMLQKRKKSMKGSGHWNALLTETKVLAIKKDIQKGLSNRDIAEKYKTSRDCISKIRCGRTWTHVKIEPNNINLLDYLK